MQHKLVNFVSSYVDLAESKLVVILVIQNVHQVCIEWMNILTINRSTLNAVQESLTIVDFL